MDIRYFLIINFHPNNETNLIIKVPHYSFYFAKYGTYMCIYGIFYKLSDGGLGVGIYSFYAYTTSPTPGLKKIIHIYTHIWMAWGGGGIKTYTYIYTNHTHWLNWKFIEYVICTQKLLEKNIKREKTTGRPHLKNLNNIFCLKKKLNYLFFKLFRLRPTD